MQFRIDIYATTIKLDILESLEDCHAYITELNKAYNKEYDLIKFEGCVFYTKDRNYNLALVRPFINPNLLFHEIYHCSEMIADSCLLETEGNKESRAYLIGYIGEQIFNLLNSQKSIILLM